MTTDISVMNDVIDVLRNQNKPTFLSFVSDTECDMNKFVDYWVIIDGKKKKNPNPTPNPFYGTRKISRRYKIVTGFDYENSVNGRREREGLERDFESKENWFQPLSKGLVTDKKTMSKYYLRYQYMNDSTLEKVYIHEGKVVNENDVKPYINPPSEYKNQGVEDTCNFQVVNLENLISITINGTKYTLR